MSDKIIERCQKCGLPHERGEYEQRPDFTGTAPRDVQCECGLILRWSVPVFKMTASGYTLRPLRDDEDPFLSEPVKLRDELLDLAIRCGADLTGKPDASEPITVVFSIEAWRKFDLATR